MAQWGRPGTELGDGFYAVYDFPDWYRQYERLEAQENDHAGGVDSRDLWAHVVEHWRDYVLPDFMRLFPQLPIDEAELLDLPWRRLREVILSLFGIPDSMTGATYAHLHTPKEEQ